MKEERTILETSLPLSLHSRGKVRDTWQLPREDRLLMVATDRVSAFDVVVGAIPGKGKILTKMSEFWFDFFGPLIKHHLISTNLAFANSHQVWLNSFENDLDGRIMIIKKAQAVIPIEFVVRGYLAGSAWEEYCQTGKACGFKLREGLKEGDKLSTPIFTPATKAGFGRHDQNVEFEDVVQILEYWLPSVAGSFKDPRFITARLADTSLWLYDSARILAQEKGIIIADTKFEFGWLNDEPVLIDEVLTPDSSRFWPLEDWEPGKPQKSFDKQYLRDWLLKEARWDKKSPPPVLPDEVIRITKAKYEEALKRLTI